MKYLKQLIESDFINAIELNFQIPNFSVSVRENLTMPDFDYQVDCSFSLAKLQKKNPFEIAENISSSLSKNEIYEKIEVTRPGFINIKINTSFLEKYINELQHLPNLAVDKSLEPQTIIVDYASPNVAKEMHVGHLRSSIIGDSIARIFSYLGHNIIKQNHIGDWGTQFGFLIEYIIQNNLSFKNISEVSSAYKAAREKFDNDISFEKKSRERLLLLQAKEEITYSVWKNLHKLSYAHFNDIFDKLGILLKEEDARGESFYNFMLPGIVEDLLSQKIAEVSEGATVIFLDGFFDKDKNPLPMIIQKSDGGYLYHTTDLAAAKFRIKDLEAQKIIYVTDARQKHHFEMLFAAVRMIGWVSKDEVTLHHIAFGTVLGEDKKPFKTRSGETISLTSLLEEAVNKAKETLQVKYSSLGDEELGNLANAIGIGALKYADLSSDLTKDYVFSWERMLSFNGNTSLYLQNAYVRIQSIFRNENVDINKLDYKILVTNEAENNLCLRISEFPEIIHAIEKNLAPHTLCNYLYELASAFHNFYETCPIGKCDNLDIKQSRLALNKLVANTLKTGLELLGIKIVDRM